MRNAALFVLSGVVFCALDLACYVGLPFAFPRLFVESALWAGLLAPLAVSLAIVGTWPIFRLVRR